MLKFIAIQNFAIIDKLEIEFGEGFNLITGETGSGKSILVDAVGMLAGSRAQQEMIRQGAEQAVIEGIFHPEGGHHSWKILREAGIEAEGGEIIIRRELSTNGVNRAYVNSRLVPLATVAALGIRLIDIHGQHAQQELLTPASHLSYLDRFAENDALLAEYSAAYSELKSLEERLTGLEESERNRLQRMDLLNFQIREIEELHLDPESDSALEEERALLANAEMRHLNSSSAYDILYERDQAVLPLVDRSLGEVEAVKNVDPSLEELHEKILNLRFMTEEISYSLRDYIDKIEVNPNRLEFIEERLNEISKLKRKYGSSIEEILEYKEKACSEVRALIDSENEDRKLQETREERFNECLRLASLLTASRKETAGKLSQRMESELSELAMKNARFEVSMAGADTPGPDGMDQAEFLISTNKGEQPRPLARVASGGELSRIMLALRTLLKSGSVSKSLIFDEVDAGIGGKTASVLGEKLARLSVNQQVFCVTHLPQVAAFGDRHYHVGKGEYQNRTRVEIKMLGREERIEELSRLMGGETVTDTTRKQASEMLARNGSAPGKGTQGRVESSA